MAGHDLGHEVIVRAFSEALDEGIEDAVLMCGTLHIVLGRAMFAARGHNNVSVTVRQNLRNGQVSCSEGFV